MGAFQDLIDLSTLDAQQKAAEAKWRGAEYSARADAAISNVKMITCERMVEDFDQQDLDKAWSIADSLVSWGKTNKKDQAAVKALVPKRCQAKYHTKVEELIESLW